MKSAMASESSVPFSTNCVMAFELAKLERLTCSVDKSLFNVSKRSFV